MTYTPDKEILDIIQTLKTGGKNELKEARKNLEKIWHRKVSKSDRTIFFQEFIDEIKNYGTITETKNKIAFVYALRWVCFTRDFNSFNYLANFLINVIQDDNGQLRKAALWAFDYLSGIDSDIFSDKPLSGVYAELITPELKKSLIEDYFALVMKTEKLIQDYSLPKYSRYKYVQSLPVSVYKSLQMLYKILLRRDKIREAFYKYKITKKHQSQIMEKGECVCALCGKTKKADAFLSPDLPQLKGSRLCIDCALDLEAETKGISKREAKEQHRKEFNNLKLFMNSMVFRYLNEKGKRNFTSPAELTAVLMFAEKLWSGIDEKLLTHIKDQPEKNLKELFMNMPVDFSSADLPPLPELTTRPQDIPRNPALYKPYSKKFNTVYQFKITLKDIEPEIYRKIQVPDTYTFWDLHAAIQDSMGWRDYHLHEFKLTDPVSGQRESLGIPVPDGFDGTPMLPCWEEKIKDRFTLKNNKALYIYDFGDDWMHEVKLEKILPAEKGKKYPVCAQGQGKCPPEDVGGTRGYERMLKVLNDKNDPEREEFLTWLGGDYDPDDFSAENVKFTSSEERLKMLLEY